MPKESMASFMGEDYSPRLLADGTYELELQSYTVKSSQDGVYRMGNLMFSAVGGAPPEDLDATDPIFHTMFLPRADATESQNRRSLKQWQQLLRAFDYDPGQTRSELETTEFSCVEKLIGKKIRVLIGTRSSEGYEDSNEITRLL